MNTKVELNKRGNLILNLTLFIISVALIILIYYLYLNLYSKPQQLNPVFSKSKLEVENFSSEISQFKPNMKFNHNNISYSIDPSCNSQKRSRVLEAFDEIEKKVYKIEFINISKNPDIEVICSENIKYSETGDYFIPGEGGPKIFVPTGDYNVITHGVILLYGEVYSECNWPNIEIHELLHVFGFDHSKEKQSLMYPYLESCDQKLDESIIKELNFLYSEENLPELYFENISAIVKGKYMDFNLTIKNSGDIDSGNVTLTVMDQGTVAKEFDLGDLKFGSDLYFQVSNLKLINRDSKDIKLILDKNNRIKEKNKINNIAELTKITN
jgi:hypothetical protein